MALEIFDLAVNIFQSIFVSYYLVECLGVKNKNINKIITYMTGFMVTLVYLEIIRYKTDFESFGIFIYLFISMMFSIVMLGGTIAEKAFYNILLLGIIVFSAVMGTGVIGLIARKDNMIIVDSTGVPCIICHIYNKDKEKVCKNTGYKIYAGGICNSIDISSCLLFYSI